MNVKKPAETDQLEPWELHGTDLRVEIYLTLTAITALVPMVTSLTDSSQPGNLLGFMSFDAKQEQNQIIRKERRLRIAGQKLGHPHGHGATQAPGNIAGISVDVELWATARHLAGWLTRNGANALPVSVDADTPELLTVIEAMVADVVDDKVLRAVLIDLRPARAAALRLIDGVDRYRPEAHCIHCDRPTLVVDMVAGVATCADDPKTGQLHPCTCSDPVCECKTNPVTYRHRWYRNRIKAHDGWLTLKSRIQLDAKAHTEEPTQEEPMIQIVPPDEIEAHVRARRHPTKHYGRAVSEEVTFYILHSATCLAEEPDLRQCPFSVALDAEVEADYWDWVQDTTIVLGLDNDGELYQDGVVRACRVCLCTDDHACDPACSWVGTDLCSSCKPTEGAN